MKQKILADKDVFKSNSKNFKVGANLTKSISKGVDMSKIVDLDDEINE